MTIETPPTWGADDLSKYLEAAFKNRLATSVHKRPVYTKLSGIDACFMKIGEGWLNPPDILTPSLFFRSAGAFRAACEHALAGQVGDLYPQLRACLECAGYALLLGKKPELGRVWLDRHQSEADTKAVRRTFTEAAIIETLMPLDGHGAGVFHTLYQFATDFGAHPNERMVTGNMEMREAEGRVHFQQMLIQGDGVAMDNGLIQTARVGVCALETMQHLFTARYELLGVRAAILDLRRGL